jgi:hypothetical protein
LPCSFRPFPRWRWRWRWRYLTRSRLLVLEYCTGCTVLDVLHCTNSFLSSCALLRSLHASFTEFTSIQTLFTKYSTVLDCTSLNGGNERKGKQQTRIPWYHAARYILPIPPRSLHPRPIRSFSKPKSCPLVRRPSPQLLARCELIVLCCAYTWSPVTATTTTTTRSSPPAVPESRFGLSRVLAFLSVSVEFLGAVLYYTIPYCRRSCPEERPHIFRRNFFSFPLFPFVIIPRPCRRSNRVECVLCFTIYFSVAFSPIQPEWILCFQADAHLNK